MSLYNLLFGMNRSAPLLLAAVGLRENDVERFRDVHASDDGSTIEVYSRTGGGNRADYPQKKMRALPGWVRSEDDGYDSTYCTDTIRVPEEWRADVAGLSDIFGHGLRKEFLAHLAVTLNREPTEDDKARAAHDAERAALSRTRHMMANGHTFVPLDDWAMEEALKLAESNAGALRSCWGIAPLALSVVTNKVRWPSARDEAERQKLVRAEIGYDFGWRIDDAYWQHCKSIFGAKYPVSIAAIDAAIEARKTRN